MILINNILLIKFDNDIIFDKNISNQFNYIKEHFNNITYIETAKKKYYLLNGTLHNLEDASVIINNFFKDYFIYGKRWQ